MPKETLPTFVVKFNDVVADVGSVIHNYFRATLTESLNYFGSLWPGASSTGSSKSIA